MIKIQIIYDNTTANNDLEPDWGFAAIIYAHDKMVLFDTGANGEILLKNMGALHIEPKNISDVFISHCHFDHTGGVKGLTAWLDCEIIAHHLDAPYIEKGDNQVTAARWYGESIQPFKVDHKLTGPDEDVLLNDRIIKAVHVPGHSPGSVVYLTESDGLKILFGQDVHGPLDASLLSDKKEYRGSLDKMIRLEADVLCEGHYGVIKGKENVKSFIESFI